MGEGEEEEVGKEREDRRGGGNMGKRKERKGKIEGREEGVGGEEGKKGKIEGMEKVIGEEEGKEREDRREKCMSKEPIRYSTQWRKSVFVSGIL